MHPGLHGDLKGNGHGVRHELFGNSGSSMAAFIGMILAKARIPIQ